MKADLEEEKELIKRNKEEKLKKIKAKKELSIQKNIPTSSTSE